MSSTNYKMTRTFHPIGHGGFYTECFNEDDYFMVYDCGSKSIDLIHSNIKKNVNVKEIDLLVISHFHNDHINGLEYILKNYRVKKILLPLLEPIEKIKTLMYNLEINSSNFVQSLCLKPEDTIRNKAISDIDFIYVSSNITEEEFDINELGNTTINSGNIITYTLPNKKLKWVYVPFNFDYTQRNKKILDEFTRRNIPINIDDFKDYFLKKPEKVREAYDEITGNLNTNSLVLYSGISINNDFDKSISYYSRGFKAEKYYMRHDKAGCLYLGDYEAKGLRKWKAFKKAFNDYFDNVSTVQIPHHGSKENYNQELNFRNNILSIISAPCSSDKHPSQQVIKDIVFRNGIPIVVTEEKTSRFVQKISLYEK